MKPSVTRGTSRNRLAHRVTAGLAALVVVAVAGCNSGSSTDSEGDGLSVALLFSNLSSYSNAMIDGAEQFAAENNAELQIFSADFDAAKQLQQCQDAVAAGKYQLLLIDPVIGSAVTPCVPTADAAGLVIGSVGVPIGPEYSSTEIQIPGIDVQVTQPIDDDGAAAGQLIVDACADLNPCKVAYLLGEPSFVYSPEREAAVRDFLVDYPNVEIVATGVAGLGDPELGHTAAQNLLLTNPDVNVIANDDDPSATGIERALREAGRLDQIRMVAGGGSEEGFEAVRNGTWFGTVLYLPRSATYEALLLMKQIHDGETPEKVSLTYAELSPTQDIVVDPETVDQLTPEWSLTT